MKKTRFLVIATVLLLLPLVSAQADPLVFSNTVALQESGARIDLFSHQGVILTGAQMSFLVDISGVLPPGGIDTIRITFSETGQAIQELNFQIPLYDSVPPPYSQLFTFTLLNLSTQPTNVTLTIDILGSSPDFIIPGGPQGGAQVNSYTYSFQVAQPVPEPTTLFLAALGVTGIVTRARRRSKKSAAARRPTDNELH